MSKAIPLPFSVGARMVTQGFNTSFSHKDHLKWGVDIGMSYGEMSRAIIGGEIVAFRQNIAPTYMQAGETRVGQGHGNYVTIRSEVDGVPVYVTYGHLAQNFLLETAQITQGEGANNAEGYGYIQMGDPIGRVGATGLRATNQTAQRLGSDPDNPDGPQVDYRGAHLHIHLGTEIIRFNTDNEWVASGLNDDTLPVHFAAFGLNADGTPTNPTTGTSYQGSNYNDFVDANYDDFPSDMSTHGRIEIGVIDRDQIWGRINERPEGEFDTDWFAVDLEAGVSYAFALRGVDTAHHTQGLPTLEDPSLRLRGPNGEQITWDGLPWEEGMQTADDGAGGRDVRVNFTPTESGTHYLVAFSQSGATGTYRLSGIRRSEFPEPDNDSFNDLRVVAEGLILNQQTQSSQVSPAIGSLPDGGFVVVWRDFGAAPSTGTGGSTTGIKARFFATDGSPQSNEFLISELDPEIWVGDPELIVTVDGDVLIFWEQWRQNYVGWDFEDAFSPEILAREVTGVALNQTGTVLRVLDLETYPGDSYIYGLEANALDNGQTIVNWFIHDGSFSERRSFSIDRDFDSISSIYFESLPNFPIPITPLPAAFSPFDMSSVVAAYSVESSFSFSVNLVLTGVSGSSTLDLNAIDEVISVPGFWQGYSNQLSDIASLSDGNLLITWLQQAPPSVWANETPVSIQGQILESAQFTPVGDIFTLGVIEEGTYSTMQGLSTSITPLNDGGFITSWNTNSVLGDVRPHIAVQLFDNAGNAISSLTRIDAAAIRGSHDIVALPDGKIVVTWAGWEGGDYDIQAHILEGGLHLGDVLSVIPAVPLLQVSSIIGSDINVERRDDDGNIIEIEVGAGAELRHGDRITTYDGTEAKLTLSSGAVLGLHENTKIDVFFEPDYCKVNLLEGTASYVNEEKNVDEASIWSRIIKPFWGRSSFEIESHGVSLGVRGTAFTKTVTLDEATGLATVSVSLEAGAVDITDRNDPDTLVVLDAAEEIKFFEALNDYTAPPRSTLARPARSASWAMPELAPP